MKLKEFCKLQTRCVLCESTGLELVLDLGNTPIANKLESSRQVHLEDEFFPLRLGMCSECSHLQLLDIIDSKILFSNYPYVSNSNLGTARRFRDLSQTLSEKYCENQSDVSGNPLVIEIGSNDGFLLQLFKEKSCDVLGIDPAEEATKIAIENGVRTIKDFFSYKLAQEIHRDYPQPKLIVANNVLAHSDDLVGIFQGIKLLMAYETVLVVEFSYALDIYNKLLIDTIYHEHMSYHSIIPIKQFLEKQGLRIFEVERFEAHGGSARISVCLANSKFSEQPSVQESISEEIVAGLHKLESWEILSGRIGMLSEKISSEISRVVNLGFTFSGYGVPAKFATLFHSLKMSEKDFSCIYDDNESKIGRLAPGTNLLIEPSSNLNNAEESYLLIFSWNYSKEIVEKVKQNFPAVKGVLIPLPEFSLVDF